jgi:F-type H+-transporting ATPase subunit epsilon
VITTPVGIVVDVADVRHVRAEDATGAFGLLPHHDELLTVLAISVVTWRGGDTHEHHVAVAGGVLTMTGGDRVEIATRDAQAGDDLAELERAVVARYRAEVAARAATSREAAKLESALVRRVLRYVLPGTRLPSFREEIDDHAAD